MTIAWHCRDCDERGTHIIPLAAFLGDNQYKEISELAKLLTNAFEYLKKTHNHENIGIYILEDR